ncbi:dienelactone hydrolase family protein [Chitinophaga sp. CF118]|uniref:carboxylesterase family protein n=1 Tax=Chitinophaga sp. CF118 TaxID=1884367 RepID=UPI001C436044|nr:dienelactone hydrolase family protein [Chitinophaga sp. CF118]
MGLFAQAQDYSAYSYETYIHNGDTLRYRMLLPVNYDSQKSYPLVIFLHGAGERGGDNAAQLLHGGSLFLKDSLRQQYPSFVIFPQCPKDSTWAPLRLNRDNTGKVTGLIFSENDREPVPGQMVKSLLDSLLKTGKINSKKVYIGGLSLGGMGTFDLITRYPKVWAAAFPICGAGNAATAARFAKVPVWIFHGGADPVVPVTFSQDYYKALKALNADVQYTEYPGVGHNSWDNVFAEPGLLKWLFSNTKK